jgi:hypothetical protein
MAGINSCVRCYNMTISADHRPLLQRTRLTCLQMSACVLIFNAPRSKWTTYLGSIRAYNQKAEKHA